jgi:hypothetical protein
MVAFELGAWEPCWLMASSGHGALDPVSCNNDPEGLVA